MECECVIDQWTAASPNHPIGRAVSPVHWSITTLGAPALSGRAERTPQTASLRGLQRDAVYITCLPFGGAHLSASGTRWHRKPSPCAPSALAALCPLARATPFHRRRGRAPPGRGAVLSTLHHGSVGYTITCSITRHSETREAVVVVRSRSLLPTVPGAKTVPLLWDVINTGLGRFASSQAV